MCGIIGLIDKDNLEIVSKMLDMIRHRGPDDEGRYVDSENNCALGMRRLSIIDLECGKQPMKNEDGSLWVVANGEIYNSPKLRKYLESKGHIFRTHNSDTEVLLHLYEEKGKDMLNDLNGMFAFAIYDKNKNIIFGARDRMGIKPLYYSRKDGKFAFSSELKALLLLPWVSKEIDFKSLYHYLSLQFVPAPDSIFIDIKKLPSGHCFIYSLKEKTLDVKEYWELNVNNTEEKSIDEWCTLIYEKMEDAVKLWTLSDVPLACSLSGGLDSSAIAGFAAGLNLKNFNNFSLGFGKKEEQLFNELPLARKVAEKWELPYNEVLLEPSKILEDLHEMAWHLDEPYSGGLPSWYIYKIISDNSFKVALTGTGGDELFGNYSKWEIYEMSSPFRLYNNLKKSSFGFWRKELKNAGKHPFGHFYHRYSTDVFKDMVIFDNKPFEKHEKTEELIEKYWIKSKTHNPRNAVSFIDFNLQLPEEFLMVTDRFSMAHSVEARVPFLDHELVELVYRIPSKMRTRKGDPKYLLKRIVKNLLPKELLTAPKKGFVLPLTLWTRNELKSIIEETLSPGYLKEQGIFSDQIYNKLVKPHLTEVKDYTQMVWTLLMFQIWHQVYLKRG